MLEIGSKARWYVFDQKQTQQAIPFPLCYFSSC
jgi:hypothetical protein